MNRRKFLRLSSILAASVALGSCSSESGNFYRFGGQVKRLKESLLGDGFTGVTFIGDSITWGTGTGQGPNPNPRSGTLADPRDNFSSESFVNNFKRYVGGTFLPSVEPVLANWPSSPSGQSIAEYVRGGKRIRVSNQGINGASTYSYASRNLIAGSKNSFALMPSDNFAVVQIGTNDRGILDRNPKNARELADRVKGIVLGIKKNCDVILMCPNRDIPVTGKSYQYGMDEVRLAILMAAQECGVDFIDNFSAFPARGASEFLADGLHPNIQGHRLISDNIQRAIELS
ncbi:SGNH/GDSL hydrolase family protein [Pseudomonas putida]|uniref:SGNH/GDSL hydrolase family protein n=1 Tax=Pseudomonas putida TaxID=303 RepID=UPI0024E17903|nr:SGNH/GDSL hydrolase family protein [Pseudomonas putida]HDS0979553.1 SGNH/GDSL hydrolase family protein [Pseudomonas putida]